MRNAVSPETQQPARPEPTAMNDNHMPQNHRHLPGPEPELYARPMSFVYALGTFLLTLLALFVLWQ